MLEPMSVPASFEAMRPVVEHEYFDHRAVPQLEQYLEDQVASNTYDCEANRALLKLYSFFPDLAKERSVALVLAKALMNLPASDMQAVVYLLPPPLAQQNPIANLLRCGEQLERAEFDLFWQETESEDMPVFLEGVPGFRAQARRFIVSALSSVFQSTTREHFESCVGLSGADLAQFAAANSELLSLVGGEVIFAKNAVNQRAPKKFKESVEFQQVLRVVKTIAPPVK